MARARNIKPGFFTNEELVELPAFTRLLFIGLWTIADRAGRLEDKPKRIKMQLFPADDIDVEVCLCELASSGFILRYQADGIALIQILSFGKHQNPHKDEKPSLLPAPYEPGASTVQAPDLPTANPADSLIPDPPIPDTGIPMVTADPEKPKAAKRSKPVETQIPDDFAVTQAVRAWANKKGYLPWLDLHLEWFIGWAKSKGKVYVDWDQTFMNAVRNDWGEVRQKARPDAKKTKAAQSQEFLARFTRQANRGVIDVSAREVPDNYALGGPVV